MVLTCDPAVIPLPCIHHEFHSRPSVKFNVQDLIRAVALDTAYDALHLSLNTAQWDLLGSYLQPFALAQGQVLIEQGAMDRTLYLSAACSACISRTKKAA